MCSLFCNICCFVSVLVVGVEDVRRTTSQCSVVYDISVDMTGCRRRCNSVYERV